VREEVAAGEAVAEAAAAIDKAPEESSATVAEVAAAAKQVNGWSKDWDDLLRDLSDMGFHDEKVNRQIMSSHGGNLTRTIKALMNAERETHKKLF